MGGHFMQVSIAHSLLLNGILVVVFSEVAA